MNSRQIATAFSSAISAGLIVLSFSDWAQAQGMAFAGDSPAYEAASRPTLPALQGRMAPSPRVGSARPMNAQPAPQMMSREVLVRSMNEDVEPESASGILSKLPRFSLSGILGDTTAEESTSANRRAMYNGPRRLDRSLAPTRNYPPRVSRPVPEPIQQLQAPKQRSRFSLLRLFGDDSAEQTPAPQNFAPRNFAPPVQSAAPAMQPPPQPPVRQNVRVADPFDNEVAQASYSNRNSGLKLRPSNSRSGSLFGGRPTPAPSMGRPNTGSNVRQNNAFDRGPQTMQRLARNGQASRASSPQSQPVFVSDEPAARGPSSTQSRPVQTRLPQQSKPLIVDMPAEMPQPLRRQPTLRPNSGMPRSEAMPMVITDQPTARKAEPALVTNPVPPRVEAKPAKPVVQPSERVVQLLADANSFAQSAATEDQLTQVVQMCRHALAIDNSPQAVEYSKDLAAWALNRRGEMRADAGRDREAMLDFDDALQTNPKLWRAVHNRGVMLAQQGQYATAFDEFNRTIELNPKFAKAYSNRAALYTQAGDLAAALEDYTQAIELDPDLAVAHKGRGRVCHMVGNFEEALQHFDAAILLASGDAHIALGRADLLADMGRYSAAIEGYYQTIELDPANDSAYRSLAWLQATCPDETFRDPEQALANAEQALHCAGQEDDLTLDTLAAAQANAGDFAAAQATQARAIELASAGDRSLYEERLALYQSNQPFRTEAPQPIHQATYRR